VPYRPGADAATAHAALLAALAALHSAEGCAALWFADIEARGLYRDLGHSSMAQYAEVALRFSPAKTAQFLRLASRLRELPALRAALAAGRLGWTKARAVGRVATPQTEQLWIANAQKLTRDDLEARVVAARAAQRARRRAGSPPAAGHEQASLLTPGSPAALRASGKTPAATPTASPAAGAELAPPVTVAIRFAPEQYALWLSLLERLHKRRAAPAGQDRAELLLAALAAYVEAAPHGAGRAESADAAPYRIVMFRCEACGSTRVETPAGPRPVAPAAAAAALCDARVEREGRTRATIPPAVRRAVLARDRHRCQAPGCRHTRFLEVHHRVPRAAGGSNAAGNLITLCSACHRLWHERGLAGGQARAP